MTEMSEKGPPGGNTLCTTPTGTSEARNERRNPERISKTVKKGKKNHEATKRGVARRERRGGRSKGGR